jgi:hypothetical protein
MQRVIIEFSTDVYGVDIRDSCSISLISGSYQRTNESGND